MSSKTHRSVCIKPRTVRPVINVAVNLKPQKTRGSSGRGRCFRLTVLPVLRHFLYGFVSIVTSVPASLVDLMVFHIIDAYKYMKFNTPVHGIYYWYIDKI